MSLQARFGYGPEAEDLPAKEDVVEQVTQQVDEKLAVTA